MFYSKNKLQIVIFVLISLVAYKIFAKINSRFEVFYQINIKNEKILNLCSSLKAREFYPTLYLRNGLLQAFFGSKSKYLEDSSIFFKKEYIQIQNYGEFCLDWAEGKQQKKTKQNKLFIVFPGLVSSTNEPYIKNIMSKIYNEGYKVCLLNDRIYTNRDTNKTITFPESEYFSFVKDCREAIRVIQNQYHNYKLYAIAHSFGANTLAKYLGDYYNENPFQAAVCVSNPWDFHIGIKHMNKIADKFLLETRKKVLKSQKQSFFEQYNLNFNDIIKSRNCVEFDRNFIVRVQGYKTPDDYYQKISSIHSIDKIKIPVLFLQSFDDPILSKSTLPFDEIKLNPNLIMVVTNIGGHVNWFEGFFQPKRWYMKPALEFIDAIQQFE